SSNTCRPLAREHAAEGAPVSTQFLATAVVPDEEELEQSLLPRKLTEFVGQERIKDQLAIALTAAKARDEALDHVLLVGAAGLGTIVRRSARILDVEIEDDAADEIARRSRGTPRIANRILKRVRDVAQVRHDGVIKNAVASEALLLLEVDAIGLERIDRELLGTVVNKFGGGPVGLSTLAVA